MSLLISELLEYSKLTHASREFVPTNLDTVVKNVLSDPDLLISETSASVYYPEPLPVIDASLLQMNQLFYNMPINALKFRKETERPVLSITFRLLPREGMERFSQLGEEGAHIEIIVADNGIGFEQQFAEQIFQLFERLHPMDEYEGTGVGLALCRKVVENHHGHIFALSEENEGAAFHVVLPVKQEQG